MNCAQVEVLLCDYLDGTLPARDRADLETHLRDCAACAGLARDAGQTLAFLERVPDVELPPDLVARILSDTGSGRHGRLAPVTAGWRGWFGRFFAPLLEPRLVMGMALTVLSFSMMAKCAGVNPRRLRPSDLEPARVWASLDDGAHRTWNRGVQFYDSVRFIWEIQSSLRQWTEQQEEEDRNAAAGRPVIERRLPSKGDAQGQPAKR